MYSLALAVILLAQQEATPTNPEIARLEALVAAGAIAPIRLIEARQTIADAEDAAILNRTLYAKISLEEFTEEQSTVMMDAAKRRAARQQEKIDRLQTMVASGVIAKAELDPLIAELDARKAVIELVKSRADLLRELTEMANAEQLAVTVSPTSVLEAPGRGPTVEHFAGLGHFNDGDLKKVVLAFEKEFARPLPVSAKGETAVHKALGFDHRGRIDVGVNPDSNEGQWIRKFLAVNKIPYIAFRRAITGQATAPHIHIGPPSPRLAAAD